MRDQELKSWVEGLLGQPESIRLEFKSGRTLNEEEKAVDKLTKEVSAFLNMDGGRIVIGIDEDDSIKPAVASQFDGITSAMPLNKLQERIEQNISPPVGGLRFQQVLLGDGKKVFVITVPQGGTAYQAKDFIYYGRSEFQCRPLRDHDIRLRMNRGNGRSATIEFQELVIHTIFREVALGQGELPLAEPKYEPTITYGGNFVLRNTGALDITGVKIELNFSDAEEKRIEQRREGQTYNIGVGINSGYIFVLYPGDTTRLCEFDRTFLLPNRLPCDIGLRWTIFLKDTLPLNGEIDISSCFIEIPVSRKPLVFDGKTNYC